jgi:hypothetical protein
MRIQARPGSPVEARYYRYLEHNSAQLNPDAIAPGIAPDASADLVFHGGKTVPQMVFQNVFLGGQASWLASDIDQINTAITLAMQDRRLNNVVGQYFNAGVKMTCDPRPLFLLEEEKPEAVDEVDAKQLVTRLLQRGQLSDSDLDSTIFNLLLPPGTVLTMGQDASSLDGLGGFHGSVHFQNNGAPQRAYYSVNVFSQLTPDGQKNGIPVFDASWKDVVGTLYHEMNEFRTDPDVGDAIEQQNLDFLGWSGARGEIGDEPVSAAGQAGDLSLVFQEILLSAGGGRVPVQFMYSNKVHGGEGPIDKPDPPAEKDAPDADNALRR